jgi:hypothetical protein
MNCHQVEWENIIELYVAGKLNRVRMRDFEEHYFGCDGCARRLDDFWRIDSELRQSRERLTSRGHILAWIWTTAAITAIVVAVLNAPGADVPAVQPPHVEVGQLDPPNFLLPIHAGRPASWELPFEDAMRSYPTHDYEATARALAPVVAAWPNVGAPRFFLGACRLLSGDPETAIRDLREVASGESAFADEARYYLAHAYLRDGRRVEALEALQQLASSKGAFAWNAQDLLTRLAPAPPSIPPQP